MATMRIVLIALTIFFTACQQRQQGKETAYVAVAHDANASTPETRARDAEKERIEDSVRETMPAVAAPVHKLTKSEQREAELAALYGAEYASLIVAKRVQIGMTKDMCKAAWGKPYHVYLTTTANGVQEQWQYSMTAYLYFENGMLTVIQN